jgi:hypothetical protein
MKWIAELMNAIAVVTIIADNQKQRIVTNLKPVHQQIISYFGAYALELYGLSKAIACCAPISASASGSIKQNNPKNRLSWCEI